MPAWPRASATPAGTRSAPRRTSSRRPTAARSAAATCRRSARTCSSPRRATARAGATRTATASCARARPGGFRCARTSSRRARACCGGCSDAREAAAGRGRRGLVGGLLGLQRGEALRRHRRLVLVLGQPGAGLGGRALVAHDLLAGLVVAVDLGEELVDEVLGPDLP